MHPTTRTQGPQGAETMLLEIKTADELRDPVLEARWAERREGPEAEGLRYIRGAFAERGGASPVDDREDAHLLPVGRALEGMARGASGGARGRHDRGRSVQARRTDLRRPPGRRATMSDRRVTVYWSST